MALCFMIMPYGRRATQVEPSSNAPARLISTPFGTERSPRPLSRSATTRSAPIRTPARSSSHQMVERLYFADLVLADMTIPNGNVYYEVGVRHAAKRTGCVLLAAEWSKPLFDVAQMRTVRYPLKEGNIEGPTAKAISDAIRIPIDALLRGKSPVLRRSKDIR